MKRKVVVLICEWVTEYDGSDVSVMLFPNKREARILMNEEYKRVKRDYTDYYGRGMVECCKDRDSACIQLEGRYQERHDRWVIEEKEIDW